MQDTIYRPCNAQINVSLNAPLGPGAFTTCVAAMCIGACVILSICVQCVCTYLCILYVCGHIHD